MKDRSSMYITAIVQGELGVSGLLCTISWAANRWTSVGASMNASESVVLCVFCGFGGVGGWLVGCGVGMGIGREVMMILIHE